MALGTAFINEHIARWEAELRKPYYAYREKWPSRLFHHSPLANAVKILIAGKLRSRADPENSDFVDVAGAGVIDARDHAHNYVRLYFRPRTPTQFHIEGIRKAGECQFGEQAHAPVLVMFVFDSRKVLRLEGTRFSDRNMQLGAAAAHDSEDYFSTIPFAKVYHEGGTGGDRSIIEHRCAEVLAESPLDLEETLQWIYCRSSAERDTLLYLLRNHELDYSQRVLISDDLRVFEKKYVFVEFVSLSSAGVIFQLNPRADGQKINVRVKAWNNSGKQIVDFYNGELAAVPTGAPRWRVATDLKNGRYRVRIELENQLAYENVLTLGPAFL